MWRIGHAQDHEKGTGCTVLVFPDGATASCDIRGGAPGTRETVLLAPECTVAVSYTHLDVYKRQVSVENEPRYG